MNRRLSFGPDGTGTRIADLGLLLFRVFVGLALAFGHGLGKLPPSERFIGSVGEMGFPAASVFAWLSAVAEFGGGILLALGLFTRPAALVVVINMCVAAFIRQAGDPFGELELALLYLAAAVLLLLTGAGRYSVDALIRRRRR